MQSSTTISLELRQEGDSLTGRAVNGSGQREFTGWIGLLAAIDELLGPSLNTSTRQEESMSIETAPAIVRPGDEGFEQGRQAFNLTVAPSRAARATSASPATRSAEGSAGTAASTACRRTA